MKKLNTVLQVGSSPSSGLLAGRTIPDWTALIFSTVKIRVSKLCIAEL